MLPFDNIAGNALKYNREDILPGVGFRGVNEGFTERVGVLNPITESLVIAGGDLDVDRFITQTMGANQRSVQEGLKVKALAHRWTLAFIKGDSSADPREFDGLQRRIPPGSSQLLDAGATSGGDALSLFKLDTLISKVDEPNYLIMNNAMALRLAQAARNTAVGGFITWSPNEFGQRVLAYNGIPILMAKEDNIGNDILPFTEANPGGGAAASTSIYAVSMGDGGVVGIQKGDLSSGIWGSWRPSLFFVPGWSGMHPCAIQWEKRGATSGNKGLGNCRMRTITLHSLDEVRVDASGGV